MKSPLRSELDWSLLRAELRRQEHSARSIPYVSFILTHLALVLFIIVAFLVDQVIKDPMQNLIFKILISVVAILCVAAEWVYAIRSSQKWRKNILLLTQLEEERRTTEEESQKRQQADALALEQLRNRALQNEMSRNKQRQNTQQQQAFPTSGMPFSPNSFASPQMSSSFTPVPPAYGEQLDFPPLPSQPSPQRQRQNRNHQNPPPWHSFN